MRSKNTKCPHTLIQHRPLYIASHIAGAGGCDDGQLSGGGCAIDRGMQYEAEIARLEIEQFSMVARAQYDEKTHERRAQMRRNRLSANLH